MTDASPLKITFISITDTNFGLETNSFCDNFGYNGTLTHFLTVSESMLRWCKLSCRAKLAAPKVTLTLPHLFRIYSVMLRSTRTHPESEKERSRNVE